MLYLSNEQSDPKRFFNDYINIKLVFDGKIDWTPERDSRLELDSLHRRSDSKMFYALCLKHKSRAELINRCISATLQNPKYFVGNLFEDEYQDFHDKRMKRCYNGLYNWSREIELIADAMTINKWNINKLLSKKKIPAILQHSNKIPGGASIETLSILQHYFAYCNRQDTIDPLINRSFYQIRGYAKFYRHNPEYEQKLKILLYEN